jgi:hypothetical protein
MVVGNVLGEYELSWDEEDSSRAAGLMRVRRRRSN